MEWAWSDCDCRPISGVYANKRVRRRSGEERCDEEEQREEIRARSHS